MAADHNNKPSSSSFAAVHDHMVNIDDDNDVGYIDPQTLKEEGHVHPVATGNP